MTGIRCIWNTQEDGGTLSLDGKIGGTLGHFEPERKGACLKLGNGSSLAATPFPASRRESVRLEDLTWQRELSSEGSLTRTVVLDCSRTTMARVSDLSDREGLDTRLWGISNVLSPSAGIKSMYG